MQPCVFVNLTRGGPVWCLVQVMLCIEPAVAGSGPFKLAPGASWTGSQTLVKS